MENLKPTQNTEQEPKTLEDYVVATFHVDVDPDDARRPLTVIRSGQDEGGVKYDRGWNPIGMLVVCDTDSEKGIGPIKLFMEVYKLVKVNGEYTTETEIVPLENIQGLEANEGYIKYLYGKTTEEMIEKGKRAARDIWNHKHPVGSEIESLAPGVGSDSGTETPSNSLVEYNTSNHEKSSADKVGPVMGGVAVEATGVREPVETNKADTNEPVRELVKRDETGAGSPALVMPEEVLVSIGAIKVNDSVGLPAVEPAKKPAETDKVGANPADLVAAEPVKKPVETNKASADLVDLPAAKSVENPVVEKSMETNEANTDILPEGFKDAINSFKQLTEDNNNQFFKKAKYIAGKLDQLRQQIQINPAVIYGLDSEGLLTAESSIIRDLEASRAKDANEFKNNIESLLESLKSKIENDDEHRRLVKLTKHVGRMGKDNVVLGNVTNDLLDKLMRIRSNIAESQSGSWGIDDYKSSISQVINEIISDLSTASGRRWSIVGGIEGIKSEGYH